jgi:hypothetical protein
MAKRQSALRAEKWFFMDLSFHLSKDTETVLRRAGWNPGRQVDTSAYEELYKREGFPVFPVVLDFLRSFGGIVAQEPLVGVGNGFHFDPVRSVEAYEAGLVGIWATVGAPLIPIGSCGGFVQNLYMSEDGEVFCSAWTDLIFLGDTPAEAIERICPRLNDRA